MTCGGMWSGGTARNAPRCATGTRTGQPGSPCQAGRRIVAGSVPCASIREVTVSGPTQVLPGGIVTVTYTVANGGQAAANGPWRDRIYLDTGAGGLVESVSLQCAKVDMEYRPQKADGSLDAGIHFKYDIKANKEG